MRGAPGPASRFTSEQELPMTVYPESYLSPQHLPFNQAALQGRFSLAPPGFAPEEPGATVVLHQGQIVRSQAQTEGLFCAGDLPDELLKETPLYFGQWDEQPCRLVSLPAEQSLPAGWTRQSLTAPEGLSIAQLSLGGIAQQVSHWDRNSQFCSHCGEPMVWLPLEWGKQCLGCKGSHFPHIHPCIIVLIWRPGEILLTRKASWPANRYSLVAGFLEMGECLEETVVREAREETGVEVGEIKYVGSQNWPFPSQLMTGFVARYESGEIEVEEEELEDARWFAIDQLPLLPPRRSISRYLIDSFCREHK
jgi:NAD+ diphosphatase